MCRQAVQGGYLECGRDQLCGPLCCQVLAGCCHRWAVDRQCQVTDAPDAEGFVGQRQQMQSHCQSMARPGCCTASSRLGSKQGLHFLTARQALPQHEWLLVLLSCMGFMAGTSRLAPYQGWAGLQLCCAP